MKSTICKLVRAKREKLGLTQSEAAKKLGLSQAYFGLIDRGYPTYVSERVANKLAKTLGISGRKLHSARDQHNRAALKDQAKWRKVMAKKAA